MPELNHVPASTPPEEISDLLRRDGYVIVDDLAPTELMDDIDHELAPFYLTAVGEVRDAGTHLAAAEDGADRVRMAFAP